MASRMSCLWLRWISTRTLRRFEPIWGDPITHHRRCTGRQTAISSSATSCTQRSYERKDVPRSGMRFGVPFYAGTLAVVVQRNRRWSRQQHTQQVLLLRWR